LVVPFCGGVTCVGFSVVVTPGGLNNTERLTGLLKLLIEVTVMFDVSEPPFGIVRDGGEAVRLKSGSGGGGGKGRSDVHTTQIVPLTA